MENYMNLSLPENVMLVGAVETTKVEYFMKNADLFVFPTHSEGFSVALVEAMASGLPIVTTDVGANKDMVESNGGRICEIDDVNSFIEAIKYFDENPTFYNSASKWNVDKVASEYDIEIVMYKIFDLYKLIRDNK